MASVRTESDIVLCEVVSLTYCGCFLTDGKVSGSGVCGVDIVVHTVYLDGVEHCLELTANCHISENSDEVCVAESLALLCYCFVVNVYGNILERYFTA